MSETLTEAEVAEFRRWLAEDSNVSAARLAWLDDFIADWRRLREIVNVIQCSFCGHITKRPKDPTQVAEAMLVHIQACEKHPMRTVLAENADLRRVAEELAKSLQHAVDTIGDSEWRGSDKAEAALASYAALGEKPCGHERLNEDGICRACGADRRGI